MHAINALAPFILISRLKPLLLAQGAEAKKFVINVSAMEGQFYRFKGPTHPHTNMAKVALLCLWSMRCNQEEEEEEPSPSSWCLDVEFLPVFIVLTDPGFPKWA